MLLYKAYNNNEEITTEEIKQGLTTLVPAENFSFPELVT